MKLSLRKKLAAVCFSTLIFSGFGILAVVILHGDLERVGLVVLGCGLTLSLFEVFYIQGRPGRWLRAMHPTVSVLIYGFLITVFAVVFMVSIRSFMDHMMGQSEPGHMMGPYTLRGMNYGMPPMLVIFPTIFGISILTIMTLRVVGYLGGKNLIHLMTGKYFRPVLEQRIFLFLDINGSTSLVDKLGPIKTRALIGKLFFDISGPITDLGGEIYRYTGDGIVAVWHWDIGIAKNRMVRVVDAIDHAVEREAYYYMSVFDYVPGYRIGIHGGNIVTSEEGDTKRAIGFYGHTIHIAARMEHMAKEMGVHCLLTEDIAKCQVGLGDRLRSIGRKHVRGINDPIMIYELQPVQSNQP
jgi:adenylate cyclase